MQQRQTVLRSEAISLKWEKVELNRVCVCERERYRVKERGERGERGKRETDRQKDIMVLILDCNNLCTHEWK